MVTGHFQVCEECMFDREQESYWRLFILIFVGHSEYKKYIITFIEYCS